VEPVPLFRGVGVALITQFDGAGNLLAEASAEHAARLVGAGMVAVLVAGSTGEAAALEPDERLALLDAVRSAVPLGSGVPVIMGTGAPSAHQATALTAAACDHGADAVLALSPPGCADPRPYYEEVTKAAGSTPTLAYHFPSVCAPGISLVQLAELPVSGCKDSSGDATRLELEAGLFGGAVWVGSPSLTLLAGALGTAGAILAVANLDPTSCLAAHAGDPAAQRRLAEIHAATSTRYPGELKELVAKRWGTSPTARLA
jgi:4-hydroxy-tetrahydrodipicolinate synthase